MWREVVIMGVLGVVLGAAAGRAQTVEETGGIRWPAGRMLPLFGEPTRLDVVDMDRMTADERLMLVTLQGIVNRQSPRVYLIEGESEEGRYTWLRALAVPYDVHLDGWWLVQKYRSEINGLVVYDPRLPDTVNVATTLAGVESGIVVAPGLVERLSRAPYDMRVLADLRGRFRDGAHAYAWQFDELWPRVTHRLLIGLDPRAGESGDAVGQLRDYAVANRALVMWPGEEASAERRLFERVLGSVAAGTPYLGWIGLEADAGAFVSLASRAGVVVAPSDSCANLSVLSGVSARVPGAAPWQRSGRVLSGKLYLTLVISDGEQLRHGQHRLRALWNDPARGAVPINWTISPLLLDVAPVIFQHYRALATPNDLLVAGPSGVGWYYPALWPDEQFDAFLDLSRRYLDRAGLVQVHVVNRIGQRDAALDERRAAALLRRLQPRGMFLGWGAWSETMVGDGHVPQAVVRGVGDLEEARRAVDAVLATWDRRDACFLALGLSAQRVMPGDILQFARALPAEVEIVTADQYFELVRQAHSGRRDERGTRSGGREVKDEP